MKMIFGKMKSKNNLEALSPTALNITLELLMRGRTLSLFDCLKNGT